MTGRWKKPHYAWVVAGVTFLTLLVAAGVRAGPSILVVPLEEEFHWSRATISLAVGINLLLYGLIGPFAAATMDRFGVRRTMVAGMILIGVGIALTPLMRDRPADVGLTSYGERPGAPPLVIVVQNPVAAALRALALGLRSRDFLLLAGSFFICGASTNGLIGTHLIPACVDHGIPEVTAAGLLAGMAIFNFVGTTGSGWLSDRVDNRVLLAIYYGLRGLSLLYLPFSFVSFYGLSLFAVFYGLDWVATVPPTVRLAAGTFGKERAGIMFGWIFAFHQVGSALAAFLGGLLRTDLGTYLQAFLIAGLLCLIAAVMVLFIGVRREGLPTAVEEAVKPASA